MVVRMFAVLAAGLIGYALGGWLGVAVGAGSATAVTILLEPDVAARFAFVAVAVAPPGGAEKYFSLTPGEPRVWRCFRTSVFEPLRWRYRIDYVAYGPNSTTLPLQSTAWADAEAGELLVRPPAP